MATIDAQHAPAQEATKPVLVTLVTRPAGSTERRLAEAAHISRDVFKAHLETIFGEEEVRGMYARREIHTIADGIPIMRISNASVIGYVDRFRLNIIQSIAVEPDENVDQRDIDTEIDPEIE